MPTRTGHTLKRVAKVSAMSWDLSPSSATKMTPKAISVLANTASTGRYGPLWSDRARQETSTRHVLPGSKVSPAWQNQAARPDVRRRTGVGQCVDRDIGGYSPSLLERLPVAGPRHTVTAVSSRTPQPGPASPGSTAESSGPARGTAPRRLVADRNGDAHTPISTSPSRTT